MATSCTHAQASQIHEAGEITLAVGLFGMLGAIAAAEAIPSHHTGILEGGAVFVPISLLGALAYIAVDSEVNQPRERALTPEERSFEAAMTIARDAKHAARRGDCAEVQAIQPRVRELNERVYRRFLHEEIIRRCLAPEPATPAPEPPPSLDPIGPVVPPSPPPAP
ncbi:MAG TPA: hypothetical protein VFQ65_03505 [Kofleriaceae bacterium]|nr:hypothetical protein [Kofleriaceae bacterium]